MSRTDDVLAAIDGDILRDFAVSSDAMRWTPASEEVPPPVTPLPRMWNEAERLAVQEALLQSSERVREQMARFKDAVLEVGVACQSLGESLAAVGVMDKPLSVADPRERALQLRRGRNTGPSLPRLDGRRR